MPLLLRGGGLGWGLLLHGDDILGVGLPSSSGRRGGGWVGFRGQFRVLGSCLAVTFGWNWHTNELWRSAIRVLDPRPYPATTHVFNNVVGIGLTRNEAIS